MTQSVVTVHPRRVLAAADMNAGVRNALPAEGHTSAHVAHAQRELPYARRWGIRFETWRQQPDALVVAIKSVHDLFVLVGRRGPEVDDVVRAHRCAAAWVLAPVIFVLGGPIAVVVSE